MDASRSIQLTTALLGLGIAFAAGSQVPAQHPFEVPKILLDSQTRETSDFTIQPPNTWRTHCTNRIASYGRPMTVGELAGQAKHPVRFIRVKMYSSGSPAANEKSIGEMLSRVWQGKFESADCFQSWDEGALWNCAAVIEFNVGAPGELITDGSHV